MTDTNARQDIEMRTIMLKRMLGEREFCVRLAEWFDKTGEDTETVDLRKLADALSAAIQGAANA